MTLAVTRLARNATASPRPLMVTLPVDVAAMFSKDCRLLR